MNKYIIHLHIINTYKHINKNPGRYKKKYIENKIKTIYNTYNNNTHNNKSTVIYNTHTHNNNNISDYFILTIIATTRSVNMYLTICVTY